MRFCLTICNWVNVGWRVLTFSTLGWNKDFSPTAAASSLDLCFPGCLEKGAGTSVSPKGCKWTDLSNLDGILHNTWILSSFSLMQAIVGSKLLFQRLPSLTWTCCCHVSHGGWGVDDFLSECFAWNVLERTWVGAGNPSGRCGKP